MIDALWTWVEITAKGLSPLAILFQVALWGCTGFSICWKFFAHKSPSVKAELASAQKNIDHWKNQFAKKELEATKLEKSLNLAQERLPGLVLAKVNAEIKANNFERSQVLIEEWIEIESPFISSLFYRASEWRLAFTEFGDEDVLALKEAQRLATIAALLTPEDQHANQLKTEIDGTLAGAEFKANTFTAEDKRWIAIHNFANANKNVDLRAIEKAAHLYYQKGNYHRSLALFHRAWVITYRAFGENHPVTAKSINNMAAQYNALGYYEEAEPLYRKGLEICQRVLGEEHPSTASSYNSVASNLKAQGRYEKAEPLFRKGLEIRQRVLGEEHPDTANSYNNVASNLNAQGHYDERDNDIRWPVVRTI